MNSDTIPRVLSLGIVLAGAQTLHGIARAMLLVPRVGKERAKRSNRRRPACSYASGARRTARPLPRSVLTIA